MLNFILEVLKIMFFRSSNQEMRKSFFEISREISSGKYSREELENLKFESDFYLKEWFGADAELDVVNLLKKNNGNIKYYKFYELQKDGSIIEKKYLKSDLRFSIGFMAFFFLMLVFLLYSLLEFISQTSTEKFRIFFTTPYNVLIFIMLLLMITFCFVSFVYVITQNIKLNRFLKSPARKKINDKHDKQQSNNLN